MIEYGPNNGNCGCFGTTIPMTPLEAFIKNVLTIGLLVWLYNILPSKEEAWKNIIYPITLFLACGLFMFMSYPFAPCKKKEAVPPIGTDTTGIGSGVGIGIGDGEDSVITETESAIKDSLPSETDPNKAQRIKDSIAQAKKAEAAALVASAKKAEPQVKPEPKGPKPIVSKFAAYPTFGGKNVKVDEGKKVICLFAPGCEHCQETAKKIATLAKSNKIPPVYIYFMDEETVKISAFFDFAGSKFPYQVIGPGEFFTLLGDGNTPGVFSQHNGNTIQSYEGTNNNEFNLTKFKKFALPE